MTEGSFLTYTEALHPLDRYDFAGPVCAYGIACLTLGVRRVACNGVSGALEQFFSFIFRRANIIKTIGRLVTSPFKGMKKPLALLAGTYVVGGLAYSVYRRWGFNQVPTVTTYAPQPE
jgi:hypothetical protein